MRYALTACCVAAAVLAGTAPGVAHHGNATFDTGKKLVLEGAVTEWVWSNPHCFLKFDVKEQDGTVRNWTVETSNPPDMVNRGWSRRSFKAGDRVTVTLEPVKNGSPVGRVLEVMLPDGRVLSARGGGAAPAAGREGAPR
ncbi:MAG: hypothetical protein HYU37_03905 [Acidobacteria bacterium]|nr:hypothetical protein [Acidobacteriota bacterium]